MKPNVASGSTWNLILMALLPIAFSFSPQVQNSFSIRSHGSKQSENRNSLFNRRPMQPSFFQSVSLTSVIDSTSTISTNTKTTSSSEENVQKNLIGNVVLLLPSKDADSIPSKFGSSSPVSNPSVLEAAEHLAKKINYFSDGTVQVHVMSIASVHEKKLDEINLMRNTNALIALHMSSAEDLIALKELFDHRQNLSVEKRNTMCHYGLQCGFDKTLSTNDLFTSMVGPYDPTNPLGIISSNVSPWTNFASAQRLDTQMMDLFERWTSDDFTIALMLFFNLFNANKMANDATKTDGPSSIPWVEHSIDATWEKGPIQNTKEFYQMMTKCGDCITKCLADENCKACIDALNTVDTRDQVASYRTVVSYESDLLREFSFCILQKHNIFGCKAEIPEFPKVTPMINGWRGKQIGGDSETEFTMEDASEILIGHLDDEDAPEGGGGTEVSWKVACGANVAYDQFPSQNQLFYKSVNGKSLWYDPVFRVETIDGRNVWAKRHYKVRNGKVPGTFYFSVLDNGVTSNEFWTIIGAADDLSWVIFHYAGAAGAVGQRYLGGLLCTPDGSVPPQQQLETEIWPLLKSSGIEPWELFVVDNNLQSEGSLESGPPPLDFFRKEVLKLKAEKKLEKMEGMA